MKKYLPKRNNCSAVVAALLILSLTLLSQLSFAQAIQTGIITGEVLDKDEEPIPAVMITLISDALNRSKVTTYTDAEGSFRIPGLSPGVYKVSALKEGFHQERSLFVNLRVAIETKVNIVLLPGEGETKESDISGGPMFFLQRPSLGNALRGNIIAKVPGFYGLSSTLASLPGMVLLGEHFSSNGADIRSNGFKYEGVNTTDPFEGLNIINMKFLSISKVEVSGMGKNVKSHPGSGTTIRISSTQNTSEFAINSTFKYMLDFMKSDFGGSETSLITDFKDFSLQLGGPVGDDRFWVQGEFSRSYYEHSDQLNAWSAALDSEYTLAARGSFYSSVNNKVSANYLGNGYVSENHFSPDLTTWTVNEEDGDAVTNDLDRNVDFLSIRNELQLSDIMRLDIGYSWMSYNKKILPSSGISSLPSIIDPVRREILQGSYLGEWQKARGERILLSGNLDFYLDEMAGTHEILLGLEVERDEISVDRGYDGLYRQYYSQGVPLYRKFYSRPGSPPSDVKSELTITRFSIFGQDSWFPLSSLSVNFGVVYNGPQVENRSGRTIDWDDISPRLAANWDMFGDGKTILRAGLSRYHENALGIRSPQDLYGLSTVFWHQSLVDLGYLTGVKGRKRWRSERDNHTFYGTSEVSNRANLETTSPYTDEIFVLLDHEPMQDVSVGISLLARRSRDILEDFEVLGAIANPDSLYAKETVTDSSGNPYHYFRRLPGEDGDYKMKLYWSEDPRLFRDYWSVEIFGKTRAIRGLELNANYTLSSSRGNIDVTVEETSTWSLSQNTPSRFINSEGYLSNDNRHRLHISAVYFAPYEITLGVKSSFISGSPYNKYLYNYDLYDLNYSIRANPRGEKYRNDSIFMTDLRLEKNILISENTFLLSLDIFNAFGNQAVIERDMRDVDSFGQPIKLVRPRAVQFGISYNF